MRQDSRLDAAREGFETTCGPSSDYQRRRPQDTVLYRVVQKNYRSFVAVCEEADRPLPRFVRKEFEEYLACGILSEGFARIWCSECGHDRLVGFSCKRRAFCPSGKPAAGPARYSGAAASGETSPRRVSRSLRATRSRPWPHSTRTACEAWSLWDPGGASGWSASSARLPEPMEGSWRRPGRPTVSTCTPSRPSPPETTPPGTPSEGLLDTEAQPERRVAPLVLFSSGLQSPLPTSQGKRISGHRGGPELRPG